MKKIYPAKDPQETLPYGFNWSPRNLGTETLTVVTATVLSGTVSVLSSEVRNDVPGAREGQGTVHVISGGVDGEMAEILLHVENAAGTIEMDQTVYLPIRQK